MTVGVVRGEPTDEEIAALAVVLIARASAAAAQHDPPPALWRDRTAALRAPLMAGPGAWRASALPY